MLTIKKPASLQGGFFLLLLAGFLAGCADPGPRALLEGEQLLAQKKYTNAIVKLTRATELLPQNAQAQNHLGLAYHHAGMPNQAFEAYQQAIRLDRNLAAVRFNLGCLLLEQQRYAAAANELATAATLQPRHLEAWLKLGTAQLRQAPLSGAEKNQWLDAARKSFEASLQLSPTAEAYNSLGVIEVQRSRARDALKLFNSALQKDPHYPASLLNLAIVYQHHLNDPRAALQKYREYLAAQPRSGRFKEIEQTARQLDLALSPPAQPAVPPVVQAPPQQAATNPAAAIVSQQVSAPKPEPARVETPPATRPPVIAAKPAEPVPALTPFAKPAPVAPVETAKPREPAPVAASRTNETPLAAATQETKPSPAAPVASSQPLDESAAPQKPSIIKRMNPVTWFKKPEETNAPVAGIPQSNATAPKTAVPAAPPTKSEVQPTPIPKPAEPVFVRYSYVSPARPAPGNRAQAQRHYQEGEAAQRSGNLKLAMEKFASAAQADPAFFEAHFKLGLAAYDARQFPASLRAYEHALALMPESASARYNFSLALIQARHPHEAAAELEKLLAQNPNDTRAHLTLANVCAQQLRDKARARKHYSRVLELEPQHPDAVAIRYWISSN